MDDFCDWYCNDGTEDGWCALYGRQCRPASCPEYQQWEDDDEEEES